MKYRDGKYSEQLTAEERSTIMMMEAGNCTARHIAHQLDRWLSAVTHELKRQTQTLSTTIAKEVEGEVLPFAKFATFAPETTGRIGSVMQKLMKSNGAGGTKNTAC